MIRDGVEAIVNPLDLYAIEIALQLRDAHGGEVIVVSMGPPKAVKAVKEAIAMGCDSGVLISDKAFAGSDTWATSYVLAAALQRIGGYDLIICGERATDGDTGQVGPGLASFLDLPVASYVGSVAEARDGTLRVHRLVESGYEILDVALPAVLTVVKEVADPRLPTLRGKQKARRTEVPSWGLNDLEVEADQFGLTGSPTRVVRIFRPTVARECRKVDASDEQSVHDAVEQLMGFLDEQGLLR